MRGARQARYSQVMVQIVVCRSEPAMGAMTSNSSPRLSTILFQSVAPFHDFCPTLSPRLQLVTIMPTSTDLLPIFAHTARRKTPPRHSTFIGQLQLAGHGLQQRYWNALTLELGGCDQTRSRTDQHHRASLPRRCHRPHFDSTLIYAFVCRLHWRAYVQVHHYKYISAD